MKLVLKVKGRRWDREHKERRQVYPLQYDKIRMDKDDFLLQNIIMLKHNWAEHLIDTQQEKKSAVSTLQEQENAKLKGSGHRRQSILVDILRFSPLSSDKELLCVSFQWRSTWKNSALYRESSRDLEKPHWRIPCLLSTVQEKKET
jgi:hypothetical protein